MYYSLNKNGIDVIYDEIAKMLKIDEKFLTIIRKNNMRSFYKAHRLLEAISIPVLEKAGTELCSRSEYHFRLGHDEHADKALQFAGQIEGTLRTRGVNTSILWKKIYDNMM